MSPTGIMSSTRSADRVPEVQRGTRLLAALLIAGCSGPTRPENLNVPPFVFVSSDGGAPGIHRFDAGTITRLSSAGIDDREPHSAAGRIVFTSRRDGNPEIYAADTQFATQLRLTSSPGSDEAPALGPTGTTIAFASDRSGAPRIWLMDSDGANPRPLETGSATFVPEGSPAWSPAGDRLAFTSTRTGASQVFVVPAAGGQAIKISSEATGAFTPEWTADGRSVLYVVLGGGPRLVRAPAGGGDGVPFAADNAGMSDPTCRARICLAATGALDGPRDLMVISGTGRTRAPLLVRAADDRQPAIIVP